jgi:glycosyltransferase involved in cell wall biosynthesis
MLKNDVIIVIPTWNAKGLILKAVNSVIAQERKSFSLGIIIRDDMSSDGTYKELTDFFGMGIINEGYFRIDDIDIVFKRNSEKLYAPGNIYESVVDYVDNDEAIIGTLDGDDSLIGTTVLKEIYDIYQKYNPFVVYTQYRNSTGGIGHCSKIEDTANYRNRGQWNSSHFRTAKAHLYKKINKEDLMYEGDYFKQGGDLALVYPLVEMAGNDRTIFYDKVCYLYNNNLPTNDHNVNLDGQRKMAKIIQSKKPYGVLP